MLGGESTPIFEGKRSNLSSPDEEAQKDLAIILVDPLDQASNDQLVMEGAPGQAGAPLEEGVPTGGPSNVDEIGEGAPSEVAIAPVLLLKPANTESSRKRLPDRVLLSIYVSP